MSTQAENCPLYQDKNGEYYYVGTLVRKDKKPFKSGEKVNTVKGVVTHPHLNVPAFTFKEDDSYVECRRCIKVR